MTARPAPVLNTSKPKIICMHKPKMMGCARTARRLDDKSQHAPYMTHMPTKLTTRHLYGDDEVCLIPNVEPRKSTRTAPHPTPSLAMCGSLLQGRPSTAFHAPPMASEKGFLGMYLLLWKRMTRMKNQAMIEVMIQ